MNINDDFLVFSSPYPSKCAEAESGKRDAVRQQIGQTVTHSVPWLMEPTFSLRSGLKPDACPVVPTYQPKSGRERSDPKREDVDPHPQPTDAPYPAKNAANLNLKLRKQALKLGMIPGSPRWRSYVLGTISAMEKRKRQKQERRPNV